MFSLKVTKQIENPQTQQIEIECVILEGKKVRETKKFGYELGTESTVIAADLSKVLSNYESEQKQMAIQAEQDRKNKITQETLSELEGMTI